MLLLSTPSQRPKVIMSCHWSVRSDLEGMGMEGDEEEEEEEEGWK